MIASRNTDKTFQDIFDEAPISLWIEDFSEVKKFIDQLKSSGVDDLRAHCKSHPETVYECTKRARITNVNKATLTLYKAKNKKTLLSGIDKTFTEESLDVFMEELLTLAEGKSSISSEAVTKTLTGELINVIVQVTLTPGYEATWSHVLVAITDITERKQAEKGLQKSEQQLSLIYDSVGDVLYYLSVEPGDCFRFLSINQTFLDATGMAKEQIVGKPVEEVISELSVSMVRDNYKRSIKEKRIVRWQETSEYPSGTKIGEVSIAPVFDDQGICTHLVGSVHDITDRVQAEIALKHSNRALRTLSACNRVLISAEDEAHFLNHICQAIVEQGGYQLAWIGCAEHDKAKSVRPVAAAGFDEGYLESLNITWADTKRGRGPTGTAIRTQEPSMVQNIQDDPRFSPWRQAALQHGYQSSIALPIIVDDELFGTLNIYAREPYAF